MNLKTFIQNSLELSEMEQKLFPFREKVYNFLYQLIECFELDSNSVNIIEYHFKDNNLHIYCEWYGYEGFTDSSTLVIPNNVMESDDIVQALKDHILEEKNNKEKVEKQRKEVDKQKRLLSLKNQVKNLEKQLNEK